MRRTKIRTLSFAITASAIALPLLHGANCSSAQAEPAPAMDANTLHLWHFDEGRGETAADEAANSQSTVAGGHTWAAGKFGSALQFNGQDGKMTLGGQSAITFEPNESYTVDAWIKVLKSGTTQQVISSTPHYELEVRPEGVLSYNIKAFNGDASARCLGKTPVDDGKWHHVATVRDATAAKLRLYIDGVLDTETDDPTAGKLQVGIVANATLGGTPDGREMLEGAIDELRISRGVRTFNTGLAATNEAAKTHTIENGLVKMVFTAQGGKVFLSQYLDKKTGVDFIEKGMVPSRVANLWQMSLRANVDTPNITSAVVDERAQAVQATRRQTNNGEELAFRWQGLPIEAEKAAVDVTMRVLLPRDSGLSQWRMNVDNRSKQWGAWIVKYPMINNIRKLSADGSQEYIAIPGGNGGGAGEGQLYRDPFNNFHAVLRTYPCYHQSMQFNAYYGPQSGLYMATHDGDSNLKGFYITTVKSDNPTLSCEVQNYPANSGVAGTGYKQEYASVLGPFQGDWYDAAQIYRGWALKQKWASKGPLAQRKDIAPAIARGSFWMVSNFVGDPSPDSPSRRQARELPVEEAAKRTRHINVEKSLELVKGARDYFDFPIVFWTSEWFDGGGDLSPPRYLPWQGLKEFLAEMHKRYPDVTMDGYVAPKRVSTQIVEYPKFIPALEHKANGEVPIETYAQEAGDEHTHPCWTSKIWLDHWAKLAYDRAALGLDGFHVDELASATGFDYQCFNRAHGHPIGGGTLYADTRRNMEKTIRENARRANPNFAAHHEALNEIYIDIDDLQEVCTSPSNNNIPLFEAVYHDYNFQMGRRIIQFMDVHTKWAKAPGDTNIDEFTASFAETFIWGNQPGWVRMDLASYSPKAAAIAKRFMHARYRAMKFLNVGQMMRSLTVTKPLPQVKTIWQLNDTPEHIQPAVLNSVWKAADGSIGIVLANITEAPQTIDYRFDLAEAGLKGKKFEVRRIDGETPQDLGTSSGSVLQRSDQVAPQSVTIIEVKPAG